MAALATDLPAVENWDDDVDFEGDLFSSSVSTALTSSRMSVKSETNTLAEESWHVHIAANDDSPATQAISSLKQVGIQLPENITSSALLGGGSIKRLGKKISRQNVTEDWGNDLVIPSGLNLKQLRSNIANPREIATAWPDTVGGDMSFSKENVPDQELSQLSLGSQWNSSRQIANEQTIRATRDDGRRTPAFSIGTGQIADSEDEDGFDDLELPTEPLDFASMLKSRQEATIKPQPQLRPSILPADWKGVARRHAVPIPQPKIQEPEDDFLDGFALGPEDVLDLQKASAINSNVRVQRPKNTAQGARKPVTTITFSDKPPVSRIPRPALGPSNVSKVLNQSAGEGLRHQPSRTHFMPPPPVPQNNPSKAQILRSKRSAPVLRGSNVPARHVSLAHPVPPLTHHLSSMRRPTHARRESDPHNHVRSVSPAVRPISRQAAPGPGFVRQTFSKPVRSRNFGDGTELDGFDDLPTSVVKESSYVKPPAGRGNIGKNLRTQPSRVALIHRQFESEHAVRSSTPSNLTPSAVPSFARDTASSRIAREQRLANTKYRNDVGITNWRATVAARSAQVANRKRTDPSNKPFLIKGVGPGVVRNEKGMTYNPQLHRWEGNENDLNAFDASPSVTPHPSLAPYHAERLQSNYNTLPRRTLRPSASHRDISNRYNSSRPHPGPVHSLSFANLNAAAAASAAATPRPALISPLNYGSGRQPKSQLIGANPQLGNEMIWDPESMKWVNKSGVEDDPFADIEDLVDDRGLGSTGHHQNTSGFLFSPESMAQPRRPIGSPIPPTFNSNTVGGGLLHSGSPGPDGSGTGMHRMGLERRGAHQPFGMPHTRKQFYPAQLEEFDPGPDFINRQRQEETYWTWITQKWIPVQEDDIEFQDADYILNEGRLLREQLLRDWQE